MRIKMASIHVDDPNAAHAFYTDVLGFRSFMHMPEASLAIVVSPEDETGTALLLEPSSNPLAKTYKEGLYASRIPSITLGAKDVQAEYDRLTELGVKFASGPRTSEWGTDAVFDDTCGNYIQIHQD